MANAPKAERISRLCDEIGYALGRGEFPEDMIREFRWLWRTTPDQEKEGFSLTLKDLESMIKEMRRERLIGTGVKRVPVVFGEPGSVDLEPEFP